MRIEIPINLLELSFYNVIVRNDREVFENIEELSLNIKNKYKGIAISKIPGIEEIRKIFRLIGIKPTKYRPSSEALLHRILNYKEIISINNVVDIGNWCSLEFMLPFCVYDENKIYGDIILRKGTFEDKYLGINGKELNFEGKYVFIDNKGAFGSPIKDSQRTSVSKNSENIKVLIFLPNEINEQFIKKIIEVVSYRLKNYCSAILERYKFYNKLK